MQKQILGFVKQTHNNLLYWQLLGENSYKFDTEQILDSVINDNISLVGVMK